MTFFIISYFVAGIITSILLAKYEYPDGFLENVTIRELFLYSISTLGGVFYMIYMAYKVMDSDLADKKISGK